MFYTYYDFYLVFVNIDESSLFLSEDGFRMFATRAGYYSLRNSTLYYKALLVNENPRVKFVQLKVNIKEKKGKCFGVLKFMGRSI